MSSCGSSNGTCLGTTLHNYRPRPSSSRCLEKCSRLRALEPVSMSFERRIGEPRAGSVSFSSVKWIRRRTIIAGGASAREDSWPRVYRLGLIEIHRKITVTYNNSREVSVYRGWDRVGPRIAPARQPESNLQTFRGGYVTARLGTRRACPLARLRNAR